MVIISAQSTKITTKIIMKMYITLITTTSLDQDTSMVMNLVIIMTGTLTMTSTVVITMAMLDMLPQIITDMLTMMTIMRIHMDITKIIMEISIMIIELSIMMTNTITIIIMKSIFMSQKNTNMSITHSTHTLRMNMTMAMKTITK